MTGRSQEELVAMLRSTKQGETVSVVVARQDDIFLPREMVIECEHTKRQHPCPHPALCTLTVSLLFDCLIPFFCALFFFFNISCTLCHFFLFQSQRSKPPLCRCPLARKHAPTNTPRTRSGLPVPLCFVDTAMPEEVVHANHSGPTGSV